MNGVFENSLYNKFETGFKRLSIAVFTIQALLMISFGYFQWKRFDFTAWDFGFFSQAAYLIAHGNWNPYSTIEGMAFYHDHASFIMLPIGLLLSVFKSSFILVVLQALAISFGQLQALLAADAALREKGIGSKKQQFVLGIALIAFFLYPWAYWGSACDFHLDPFIGLFSGFMLYGHYKRKSGLFWSGVILAILSKDISALYVAAFGVYLCIDKGNRQKGLWVLGISIAYFGWCTFLFKTGTGHQSHLAQMYGYLGSSDSEIIKNGLLKPGLWIKQLISNWMFYYAILMPLLFVPIFSWKSFLPVAVLFLLSGLSTVPMLNDPRYYYPTAVLPYLLISFCFGLNSISQFLKQHQTTFKTFCIVLLAVSAAWSITWLPILPENKLLHTNASSYQLESASKMIPNNSTVISQNSIMGRLAQREHVYLLNSTGNWTLSNPTYFLLDPFEGNHSTELPDQLKQLETIANLPNTNLLYHENYVWLFQSVPSKTTADGSLVSVPSEMSYAGWTLPTNAGYAVTKGPVSEWYQTSNGKTGYVTFGPYQRLGPGNYQANISLSSTGPLNIEVWYDGKPEKVLNRISIHSTNGKETFELPFQMGEKEVPSSIAGKLLFKIKQTPDRIGYPIEIRVWTPGNQSVNVYKEWITSK